MLKKPQPTKIYHQKCENLKLQLEACNVIKKDSDADAFAQILRNFKEPLFYRTIPVAVSES